MGRQQLLAQRAHRAITARKQARAGEEYSRICKTFPALMHNSGLCQAVAFVQAKAAERPDLGAYLDDLAGMLEMGAQALAEQSRTADVTAYLRLSREALSAVVWLKRYAEALLDEAAVTNSQTRGGAEA